MDVNEAIYGRRSTREYTEDAVDSASDRRRRPCAERVKRATLDVHGGP